MVYKKDMKKEIQKIEKDVVEYYLSTPMSINRVGVSKRKIYYYPTLSQINYNAIVDVLIIGDFLYKDATIFLQRKKNKFLDFKNHYNL